MLLRTLNRTNGQIKLTSIIIYNYVVNLWSTRVETHCYLYRIYLSRCFLTKTKYFVSYNHSENVIVMGFRISRTKITHQHLSRKESSFVLKTSAFFQSPLNPHFMFFVSNKFSGNIHGLSWFVILVGLQSNQQLDTTPLMSLVQHGNT